MYRVATPIDAPWMRPLVRAVRGAPRRLVAARSRVDRGKIRRRFAPPTGSLQGAPFRTSRSSRYAIIIARFGGNCKGKLAILKARSFITLKMNSITAKSGHEASKAIRFFAGNRVDKMQSAAYNKY